jgi:hypothetical protein
MLEPLFGNKTAERVLLYLANYGQGYARDIALTFETTLSMVQKQLQKGEMAGILVSRLVGKTRVYELNPRYYFQKELLGAPEKGLGRDAGGTDQEVFSQAPASAAGGEVPVGGITKRTSLEALAARVPRR